ncbi:hypothetical protein CHARACLAT_020793 [Characodon lateralis]|uniref:Uncharacterized protein n=1 Tax=Characodon lateralis TaxID=208331 RepID=A0ABU7D2V1_9TELE|nr:hypothetical protein [Characodon lateralis]
MREGTPSNLCPPVQPPQKHCMQPPDATPQIHHSHSFVLYTDWLTCGKCWLKNRRQPSSSVFHKLVTSMRRRPQDVVVFQGSPMHY